MRDKRQKDASVIRQVAFRHKKQIEKNEKKYLRRAQERRFELQVMNEASKIR